MRRAMGIVGLACWALASAGEAGQVLPTGADAVPVSLYGSLYGGGNSHHYHDERPAPAVQFDFSPGIEGMEGLSYAAGANIRVTVTIRAEGNYNRGVRGATGRVTIETTEGKTILRLLGHLDARNNPKVTEFFTLDPGSYRVTVKGEALKSYFTLRSYVVRSKVFDVMSEHRRKEERAKESPPRFEGRGLRVGVVADGYGSEGILNALNRAAGIQAVRLRRVTADFARPCQVIVLPWRRESAPLSAEAAVVLNEFVGAGGGLLVTHDSVGYRGQPALFPDISPGGADCIESEKWIPVVRHPLTEGLELGKPAEHSYHNFVSVRVGPRGRELADGLAKEWGGRAPALVCGEFRRGRYVACGLAPGVAPDDSEQEPRGAELRLLLNSVRWLGHEGR